MRKGLVLFFLIIVSTAGFSQKSFNFRFWEDSLIQLRNKSIHAYTELERYQANEDFMNLLESVLMENNSFKFGWDSVRNFSVLSSPDKLFKLFTWHVFKDDSSVENYGFIQVYNEARKKYVIYPLYDKRNTMDYPKTVVGDHNRWYGAVYYKIIPLQAQNRTYYTLLGWNGNNLFTNEKVIEILYFKSDKSPVFGATIFRKYPEKCARVILEYAKNSSLSLKYQKHSYNVGQGKRDPKTRELVYESLEKDMIIFEQIIPMENGLDDIPSFSVPESSLNQGFVEDNGKWLFVPSVNGRNPDKKDVKYTIKRRNFYTPPN